MSRRRPFKVRYRWADNARSGTSSFGSCSEALSLAARIRSNAEAQDRAVVVEVDISACRCACHLTHTEKPGHVCQGVA